MNEEAAPPQLSAQAETPLPVMFGAFVVALGCCIGFAFGAIAVVAIFCGRALVG